MQLLAHESAHTAQQSRADAMHVSLPPADGGADTFEDEASRMGDAAIDASVPPPNALSAAPTAQVQRWPWSDDEKPAAGGGGSLWDSVASGASIVDGTVYFGSGYGQFATSGTTGNNKLFAFSLPGKQDDD